jgi:hypothetical protein
VKCLENEKINPILFAYAKSLSAGERKDNDHPNKDRQLVFEKTLHIVGQGA